MFTISMVVISICVRYIRVFYDLVTSRGVSKLRLHSVLRKDIQGVATLPIVYEEDHSDESDSIL